MRKLILAALLAASICAYPHKHNYHIVYDTVEFKNWPSYTPKKINVSTEKLREALFCNTTTPRDDIHDTVNACADKLFEYVDQLLAEHLDPLSLPDMHTGFNYTLIITYHGELDLTNGNLGDFSSIHRGGDIDYSKDDQKVTLTLPIAFDDLAITYDYSAKIMGLGPTGGIEGSVTDLAMEVTFGFDYVNLLITLEDFTITNSGHIDFKFTGHALIDWLLNLLTDVVTSLLKKVILSVVEDVVGGALEAIVDEINSILHGNDNSTFIQEFALRQAHKTVLEHQK
ncbi:uncharacterized protein [Tenebrio molitor]|uniref:uncharacterized protein n=1 Tax=Tenebrio molitor TaxID=7067 RepID=UPI0036249ADF